MKKQKRYKKIVKHNHEADRDWNWIKFTGILALVNVIFIGTYLGGLMKFILIVPLVFSFMYCVLLLGLSIKIIHDNKEVYWVEA